MFEDALILRGRDPLDEALRDPRYLAVLGRACALEMIETARLRKSSNHQTWNPRFWMIQRQRQIQALRDDMDDSSKCLSIRPYLILDGPKEIACPMTS